MIGMHLLEDFKPFVPQNMIDIGFDQMRNEVTSMSIELVLASLPANTKIRSIKLSGFPFPS